MGGISDRSLEVWKWDLLRPCNDFPEFKHPDLQKLLISGILEIGFKDVGQGRAQVQMKVLKEGTRKPMISQELM